MKSPLFLTAVLFLTAASLCAQDTNRWTFFQNLEWQGRLDFIKETPAAQTDGEFLLQVLTLTDSERIEAGSDTDIATKKSLALQVVRLLTDLRTPGAAVAIARLPRQYKDPILRGESWLALAKLGDQTSAAGMIQNLTAFNQSASRSRGEEIQAAYLVQALGILKSAEAFRTVAEASLAWYAPISGVKAQAKRVMPSLVPDLEKAVLQLLATDQDLALREGLFLSVADEGDKEKTARAASAVLGTIVTIQTRDKADQDRIQRLTQASLLAAQKSVSPPAALLTPLKLLVAPTQTNETIVQSIRLLGKIKDPAAATLLSSTLSRYNTQQRSGTNKASDLLIVKELFTAMAATAQVAARPPLEDAKFAGYTPAMVKDAQEALDQLPQK